MTDYSMSGAQGVPLHLECDTCKEGDSYSIVMNMARYIWVENKSY